MNILKQPHKQPQWQHGKPPKLAKVPTVSICTPTYNRRPFIPYLIMCLLYQTYPLSKIEWIVVDDGEDLIGDILENNNELLSSGITLKYINLKKELAPDHKYPLGHKRNVSHMHATGDLIIYMDDDDYYPPERIEHAVEVLKQTPKAWAAGSSEMHIYFKQLPVSVALGKEHYPVPISEQPKMDIMYRFGPYDKNHATAATFAFHRELLKYTKYEDKASISEEKVFLKYNTVPFAQLEVRKTILVFSHNHNSFDKRVLLNDIGKTDKINRSQYTIDDFFQSPREHITIMGAPDPVTVLRQFYMKNVDEMLEGYTFGEITKKPDVLKQVDEIIKTREQLKKDFEKKVKEQFEFNTLVHRMQGGKSPVSILSPAEIIKENTDLEVKITKLKQLMKKETPVDVDVDVALTIYTKNEQLKTQLATLKLEYKNHLVLCRNMLDPTPTVPPKDLPLSEL